MKNELNITCSEHEPIYNRLNQIEAEQEAIKSDKKWYEVKENYYDREF